MAIPQPHQAYKQNSINTALPEELTLLLYNGCLKFIKLAKRAMDDNNISERNVNLIKAQKIIQELMITLNMDIELSQNLMRMYDYLYNRLIEANTKNDVEIINEVEGYIAEFRDTWKSAIQQVKKQQLESSQL